jgi:hypothetical protein
MDWRDFGSCVGDTDPEAWFDTYENNKSIRPAVDHTCMECPVQRTCFAYGVSHKQWGVWGGVYLIEGDPSMEFSDHRSKSDWADLWESLTMEV